VIVIIQHLLVIIIYSLDEVDLGSVNGLVFGGRLEDKV